MSNPDVPESQPPTTSDPPVTPPLSPPAAADVPAEATPITTTPVTPTATDTTVVPAPVVAHPAAKSAKSVRILGLLVLIAGAVFIVAGVVTWFVVREQLADEKITVSDDAVRFQGWEVDGPFTAYAEADVIEKHALEASGGLTYAEIPREDPTRETVMTASFLRASLFTSVVAFGVAFMAAGLGLVLILIGIGLMITAKRLNAVLAGGGTVAVAPAA